MARYRTPWRFRRFILPKNKRDYLLWRTTASGFREALPPKPPRPTPPSGNVLAAYDAGLDAIGAYAVEGGFGEITGPIDGFDVAMIVDTTLDSVTYYLHLIIITNNPPPSIDITIDSGAPINAVYASSDESQHDYVAEVAAGFVDGEWYTVGLTPGEAPPETGDLFWTWTRALYRFNEPNPAQELSRFPTDTVAGDTVTEAGVFDEALDISTSDPVTMRNTNNGVDLSGGDFTVEFWLRRGAWENFANVVNVPGSWDFIFNEWGGTPSFRVYGPDNNVVWGADLWGGLPENTWQHFCFERSGDMYTSYVNGVSTGQAIHAVDLPSFGDDVFMTFGASGGAPGADALIDDFRLTKAARYRGENFTLPDAPNPAGGDVYVHPVAIFEAGVADNVDGYLGGVAGTLYINKLGYPLIGCWILDAGTQLRIAIDIPELDLTGHTFIISGLGTFPVSEATVYNPEGYTSFWYDLAEPLAFVAGETYSIQLPHI